MSVCIHEAKQISTLNLTQKLQQELLKHCCIIRKTTEKLVDIRNFEYGHANNARMSDSDFEESKKTIIESILLIAKLCGKDTEMKKAIDATLRESLDHKLVEKYKELMSEIYKNLQQQNKKIQEMESNIVQTNTRIDEVSSSVDIIYNRVDDTNEELERTNTRVDVISNRVDDTKTELDRTNTRVDVISNRVDDTKTELGRTNTRVDVISNRVDDTKTELGRTNTRVDVISNRADDTNTELGRTNTRFDVISNRVDDTKTELGRTNRKVDVISNRVDKSDAGLETLQTKINDTDQLLGKVNEQVEDPVPPNIREQNSNELKQWKKIDKDFVQTRASKCLFECVSSNACVTITGPAGCGKTFLARHTALLLKEDGYDIIIIKTPKDIRDFYKPGRKTLFIVDDICGNFTASQEKIDNWLQFKDIVDKIVKDPNCKIVMSCRLQIYRDANFNSLSHFVSCECNLISEDLCLLPEEKAEMIKQYTGETIDTSIINKKLGTTGAFLPLLCFLYRTKSGTSALEFLQNPFAEITKELDTLFNRKEDLSKYKICSLALFVLFNNNLEADWFKGEITQEQRSLLDDLSDACKLDRRLSKQSLEDELNTLIDTFVIKQGTVYKAVHDKVFDYFAWYFGKKIISCIIKHGDSHLIHERFRWNLEEIDRSGDMEYIIIIPNEHRDQYIGRMVTDWSNGKVIQVFNNINMIQQVFRHYFLRYLSSQNQYNINHLIEKKDSSKIYKTHGSTALIQSIFFSFLDLFEWLLNHNESNVSICDDNGKSPLWIACARGNVEIVTKLLEKNPDVNLCNESGQSPLWIACYKGDVKIVSKLLEKDPDVNLCDEDGKSPLWMACYRVNVEIVTKLLEKDPDVNLCYKDGWSPLVVACYHDNVEIVSKLLKKDPDVNHLCDKYGWSPLVVACYRDNVEIVSKLLKKDPDINLCDKDGRSPLWVACCKGNVEIVSKLLEKNPDVNLCDKQKGQSPLWTACNKGNVEIVSKLLEKDPNVNLCDDKESKSPLWIACENGNVEIVSKLLEKDPDVNLCDVKGQSPLVVACYVGNVEIVSKLLEKNPDMYASDEDDDEDDLDPLYIACERYPLYIACEKGNVEILSKLLEKDPKIDVHDQDGQSPLGIACYKGNVEIVSKLLEKNPDVNICEEYGMSPLSIAKDQGHEEIIELLERYLGVESL